MEFETICGLILMRYLWGLVHYYIRPIPTGETLIIILLKRTIYSVSLALLNSLSNLIVVMWNRTVACRMCSPDQQGMFACLRDIFFVSPCACVTK